MKNLFSNREYISDIYLAVVDFINWDTNCDKHTNKKQNRKKRNESE